METNLVYSPYVLYAEEATLKLEASHDRNGLILNLTHWKVLVDRDKEYWEVKAIQLDKEQYGHLLDYLANYVPQVSDGLYYVMRVVSFITKVGNTQIRIRKTPSAGLYIELVYQPLTPDIAVLSSITLTSTELRPVMQYLLNSLNEDKARAEKLKIERLITEFNLKQDKQLKAESDSIEKAIARLNLLFDQPYVRENLPSLL